MRGKPRQVPRAHLRESGIGEPHGVDHAALELGNAGCGRALPCFARHRFRDKAAKAIERHDPGELLTVARRAGRENDWVLKGEVRDDNP